MRVRRSTASGATARAEAAGVVGTKPCAWRHRLVGADAGGAAQAARDRDRLAFRRDLHRPAAEQRARVVGLREAEGDVQVAVRVDLELYPHALVIAFSNAWRLEIWFLLGPIVLW